MRKKNDKCIHSIKLTFDHLDVLMYVENLNDFIIYILTSHLNKRNKKKIFFY